MSAGRWTTSGRGSPLDGGAPCASHSGPMSRSDWRSHPARWDHHHGSDLEALLTTSGTDAGVLLPRAYGARTTLEYRWCRAVSPPTRVWGPAVSFISSKGHVLPDDTHPSPHRATRYPNGRRASLVPFRCRRERCGPSCPGAPPQRFRCRWERCAPSCHAPPPRRGFCPAGPCPGKPRQDVPCRAD